MEKTYGFVKKAMEETALMMGPRMRVHL